MKSPPSLKELSAQSLAAKLARNDSKCIAGVCVNKTCKHAAQQCKHFPATNGAAALKQGDNGVKKYPVNLTPQTVGESLDNSNINCLIMEIFIYLKANLCVTNVLNFYPLRFIPQRFG